ncbi:hypothetical protein LARV_03292 [Longilinea arvoryzae]|uniref:DUF429 domain-containing protein n=1 Tax=Longilinea arvoryzae TaxID=360412 RepID=A0A0S7BCD2_9CHLR|nr:hypothetical protein [Longilinea arvoryzae]GAP15503.1 hypothetical protein LARV_03292 [Longilinea arvoryzae]
MVPQPTVFIGIEPGSGHKACAMMVLDEEQHIQAQGCGDLADALAFAAGVSSAVVAINAPAKLNDIRGGRAAEKELLAQGAWIYQTPTTLKACPASLRRGLEVHQALAGMGYVPGPGGDAPRQKFEAPADAAFWSLLGLRPFDQTTLEGRLQRQLVLADAGLPVPDAMDFFEEITRHKLLHGLLPLEDIYRPEELNALMCAHVAWCSVCQPESVKFLGDSGEGSLAIPLAVQKQIPQP